MKYMPVPIKMMLNFEEQEKPKAKQKKNQFARCNMKMSLFSTSEFISYKIKTRCKTNEKQQKKNNKKEYSQTKNDKSTFI